MQNYRGKHRKMPLKRLLIGKKYVIMFILNNQQCVIESGLPLSILLCGRYFTLKNKPIEEIKAFLEPFAKALGVEIYDAEFKLGKEPALTVFIDKEGGVDLNTCEAFHRAIDEPLDHLDPTFGEPYTLNVSSPGLDRPLKTDKDFARAKGKKVEVKLFAPMKGKKFFEAILEDFTETCVFLNTGKETEKIERAKIARINEAIDFD